MAQFQIGGGQQLSYLKMAGGPLQVAGQCYHRLLIGLSVILHQGKQQLARHVVGVRLEHSLQGSQSLVRLTRCIVQHGLDELGSEVAWSELLEGFHVHSRFRQFACVGIDLGAAKQCI